MADECQPPDHDDRGDRDECARTPLIRGRRSEAEYQPDRIESELEVDNSPSRRLQSWLLTLHTRRDEAQGRRDRPDTWYLHLLSPGWTGTEDSRSRSWGDCLQEEYVRRAVGCRRGVGVPFQSDPPLREGRYRLGRELTDRQCHDPGRYAPPRPETRDRYATPAESRRRTRWSDRPLRPEVRPQWRGRCRTDHARPPR